jgi:alkanesulfonate monooxygenase SsuD/methylene tetrahydromethanopterin reductase-like flavin-dependent oxidoreductase (luciferase family)
MHKYPIHYEPDCNGTIRPSSPENTAKWAAGWADGLITTSRPPGELKRIIDAFMEGGGEGKPVYLKVQLSYDSTFAGALAGAHEQWKNNVFSSMPANKPEAGQEGRQSSYPASGIYRLRLFQDQLIF